MATIRDVAKHAGVSAGTVSNVLNRPSYVSREVRERVQAAMRDLDFTPSAHARQYRRGRVRSIGIVMATMDYPFFVDVALHAEEAARADGVAVVFCHSGYDEAREDSNIDLLMQQRAQGVIITPVNENSERLESMMARGVPVVFVDRVSGDRDCCSVVTDDIKGGALAGHYLLERGHRHVAFVGDPDMNRQVSERLQGFRDVVVAAGGVVDVIRVPDWAAADGLAAGERLSAEPPKTRPTAVFAVNDLVALGLMQRLTTNGVAVPGDVAVVGFDDLDLSAMSTIPLTTVRQPTVDLGRIAYRLVMDEINNPEAHRHERVVLPPELVVRLSA